MKELGDDFKIKLSSSSKNLRGLSREINNAKLKSCFGKIGDPKKLYETFYMFLNRFIDYKPSKRKMF
ncbi:MAG: hypothetical protein PVJ67_02515 [Candidatus Pacearchaeota archaeon]|jgi:hypothetical protein